MKLTTKNLVYLAMYIALAIILDLIKEMVPIFEMPMGGSVNIAAIPIVLCSFHLGCLRGSLAGLCWYLISSLLGLNYPPVSFMECLLDYLLPSIILGCASFLWWQKKDIWRMQFGILIVNIIRMISIIIAGAYYWFPESSSAGSAAAWLNSLSYNSPYLLATTLLLMVIVPLIYKRIQKYLQK